MSADLSTAILEVRGLRCSIAGQQVVEDVTFSVPATGITAVLGRNGVGKTSTLRGILGLIHRRGEVTLAGERIDGLATHRIVQRGVGYVPEDREVFAKLTVAENLALAERQRNPRREFVDALFPDLVQRRAQMAGTLSGGQQQRVAIARAIVADPTLLVCDEPTGDLDRVNAEEIMNLLRALNRSHNKTIVMVTHDPRAAEYASRELHLDKGQLAQEAVRHVA